MRLRSRAVLGGLLLLAASPTWAAERDGQTPPASAPQVTVFGAWETHCAAGPAGPSGAPACRVVSSITVPVAEGQRAVAAVVVVNRAPAPGSVQLLVQLPTGVWLPPGVRLEAADGALVASLPFVVCSAAACEAGAVLTAEQWGQVAASTVSLSLRYELQGQQVAKLDFSMNGFAAAATSVGLPAA